MSDKCRGTLVFYRWPIGTDWNEAPAERQIFLPGDVPVVHLGIWQGHHRGNEETEPWHLEVRTAVALAQLEDLPRRDADTLQHIFESGPLQCRNAASSVLWLPGRMPSEITTFNDQDIPELLDLIAQGEVQLLEGLLACVRAFPQPKRGGTGRR